MTNAKPLTYAAAGVDTAAGDSAVELMRAAVARTHGPQVLGGFGAFAGLFDARELAAYRHPLLATSTDGVGTKVAIAQALDKHDTIGFDLVAMVVDDLVVVGAKPLFMTDYIACGRVVPERIAAIVGGIAAAAGFAGVALIGGETAEHPGLLGPHEYDVAGAATGVVEADALLGPQRVRAGDQLVAFASSGLHSNGFSLVRAAISRAGWSLDRHVDELATTLGEALLTPTRIYAPDVLALAGLARAFAHITGGGLAANLARVLPRGLVARVERATWRVPPVFSLIKGLGSVPVADLEATLNLGVGMVALIAPEHVDEVLRIAASRLLPSWVLGEVSAAGSDEAGVTSGTKGVDGGGVRLAGDYRW